VVALLLALWFGWRGLAVLWLSDVVVSLVGPTSVDLGLAPATATAVVVETAVAARCSARPP
jgi:hypothetical protein